MFWFPAADTVPKDCGIWGLGGGTTEGTEPLKADLEVYRSSFVVPNCSDSRKLQAQAVPILKLSLQS